MDTDAPPLLDAHISRDTPLGRQVAAALAADGYLVLRGVLSPAECAAAVDRLWAYVEACAPGVQRGAPDSWYPPPGAPPGAPDPWPHTGWKSFADMFQTNGAGWVFVALREKLAERVFAPIFDTRRLHTSKEGFTFLRPTKDAPRHPLNAPGRAPARVCGRPVDPATHSGEHFDQRADAPGLRSIQSVTALLDQGPEDACFLCWPGSHAHHARLTAGTWRGRSDWVPLTDAELASLRAAGLAPRRVPARAGDVILWRSDLAHAGAPPTAPSAAFRAVAYAGMAPAALTPARARARKAAAWRELRTGDHVPSREAWHAPKAGAPPPRGSFFPGGPPALTRRQARLHGTAPYDDDDDEEAEEEGGDGGGGGDASAAGAAPPAPPRNAAAVPPPD